ncbi:MAG TPA: hypothetical protein P5136_00595 [Methanofastidiosum sp.]|nr:hypothetical protein [Methanofastidiosum sp.]
MPSPIPKFSLGETAKELATKMLEEQTLSGKIFRCIDLAPGQVASFEKPINQEVITFNEKRELVSCIKGSRVFPEEFLVTGSGKDLEEAVIDLIETDDTFLIDFLIKIATKMNQAISIIDTNIYAFQEVISILLKNKVAEEKIVLLVNSKFYRQHNKIMMGANITSLPMRFESPIIIALSADRPLGIKAHRTHSFMDHFDMKGLEKKIYAVSQQSFLFTNPNGVACGISQEALEEIQVNQFEEDLKNL